MFSYDLRLALDSMKRHPGLAALMVLAIALGIAVCTVTFTMYHAMATNPIPERVYRNMRGCSSFQEIDIILIRPSARIASRWAIDHPSIKLYKGSTTLCF